MKIRLNGKDKTVMNESLKEFLGELGIDLKYIVIEINGEIIARESHETHVLNEGDVVEIIKFMGGG